MAAEGRGHEDLAVLEEAVVDSTTRTGETVEGIEVDPGCDGDHDAKDLISMESSGRKLGNTYG